MVRIVLPKVYFSCSVGRSLEQIEENESRKVYTCLFK